MKTYSHYVPLKDLLELGYSPTLGETVMVSDGRNVSYYFFEHVTPNGTVKMRETFQPYYDKWKARYPKDPQFFYNRAKRCEVGYCSIKVPLVPQLPFPSITDKD